MAFPEALKDVKGETFRNSGKTHIYRTYGKEGSFAVRSFNSEQEAYKALILSETGSNGEVKTRINTEILSQGRVRSIKTTAIDGFYTTYDTGRTGFFWLNGKMLYSVEAGNRSDMESLLRGYPYLKLKFNPLRILSSTLRRSGSWILPLSVTVILLVLLYSLWTGILGVISLTGSKKGSAPTPMSESEISAALESLNGKSPFSIKEDGRFDYRVDRVVTAAGGDEPAIKTRSAFLTLDPLIKTVFMKEIPVVSNMGKKGPHTRSLLKFFPVIPRSAQYRGSDGESITSVLLPVVTNAGWRWRPETEIPTTNATLNKMGKRSPA
jgi:hypothetical protein